MAFQIDHFAHPCFDVRATDRFYADVLGATLRHAQMGPAEAWNAKAYLLLAYELPGGVTIDFFTFDGIRRPDEGLPKDVRHYGLTVATRDEVRAWKARFEAAGVPVWVETHDVDDVHVYATDPNGLVLEVLAKEDGVGARAPTPDSAAQVMRAWLDERE